MKYTQGLLRHKGKDYTVVLTDGMLRDYENPHMELGYGMGINVVNHEDYTLIMEKPINQEQANDLVIQNHVTLMTEKIKAEQDKFDDCCYLNTRTSHRYLTQFKDY